ncbi:hypothetical protein [Micromonospora endophytica]|uniref:DUF4367 domain-containing protein n=1 Tax=Micromonospora endophytica TaxID=515350 RepID=A0A2W2CMU6_9ACTN|nr:hypothetical protein [Micromonospora endophytica]PZF99872.1 hypothetical protein C1I93_04485 [Micromonospora endophytica]RIW41994.1 hypothetical protein D3H59_24350 [Micromonospora endophytica]
MADLERELRELSGWLATPEPPDVRTQVRARIAAPPRVDRRRRRWRYAVGVALAALLVALLPPGRAAVADAVTGLLRFAGITVDTSSAPVPPTGSPAPLPGEQPAGWDEARHAVRFPLRAPAALGPPERVLVADPDDEGGHRVASLLYRGGSVRLDAFDGSLDPVFFKQSGGSGAEWTEVAGQTALWLAGPHPVSYVDRGGTLRQESARLAAATLIWEQAGVTYRLEGELSAAEAVSIATSLE